MIGQVYRRLQLLVAQGVATLVGAEKVQAKVLDGEVLDNVARVEPYGFSYRPKAGAQTYLLFPAGDRSYGVAIVVGDKRYQMSLQEGEVGLHDDEGNHVHLRRGGVIEVKAATKVVADTPLFETSGDAVVGGSLTVAGRAVVAAGYYGADAGVAIMSGGLRITGEFKVNGKDVSDSHTHTSAAAGAPTSGVI